MEEIKPFKWSHSAFVDGLYNVRRSNYWRNDISAAYSSQSGRVYGYQIVITGIITLAGAFTVLFTDNMLLSFATLCIFAPAFFMGVTYASAQIWYSLVGPTWSFPVMKVAPRVIAPGERLDFDFSMKMMKATQVVGEVQLVVRESVSYSCGTDTCYDQVDHVIDTLRIFENLASGELLSKHGTFEIPPNAMPTFKAPSNKIGWLLVVRLETDLIQNYQRLYQIEVMR